MALWMTGTRWSGWLSLSMLHTELQRSSGERGRWLTLRASRTCCSKPLAKLSGGIRGLRRCWMARDSLCCAFAFLLLHAPLPLLVPLPSSGVLRRARLLRPLGLRRGCGLTLLAGWVRGASGGPLGEACLCRRLWLAILSWLAAHGLLQGRLLVPSLPLASQPPWACLSVLAAAMALCSCALSLTSSSLRASSLARSSTCSCCWVGSGAAAY